MAELPDIELTETSLSVDGTKLRFSEVETVGYLRRPVRGTTVLLDVLRRFELTGGGRTVGVKLDGAKVLAEEKEATWRHLVAISQQQIEPRLRTDALARLQAGETVTIGKIELSPQGIMVKARLGTKRVPWSDFREAFYATSRIQVTTAPVKTTAKGENRQLGQMFTDTPNAVLLPRLMADAAAAFTA